MVNENIFLGSGTSTTFVPELDLTFGISSSAGARTDVEITGVERLVPDLYVGCEVIFYTAAKVRVSAHTITNNGVANLGLGSSYTHTAGGSPNYGVIQSYGAPCYGEYAGSKERLNADNWLGILETVTFPTIEQEIKQLNLGLGATRDFTFQYKGIRTASGGSLTVVANHGAWLYYALGSVSTLDATVVNVATPSNDYTAVSANDIYINGDGTSIGVAAETTIASHTNTGPIFYRTSYGTDTLLPPIQKYHTAANFYKVTKPTIVSGTLTNPITYTIVGCNSSALPSFTIEQSIAKEPSTLTGDATTTSDESTTFTRIARGNRVESLSLEATDGEELKMTITLNTRLVDSITRLYQDQAVPTANTFEARAGIEDNAQLFNWSAGTDNATPFFFSTGTFSAFGQQFMKVNSVNITINNNLVDKRYMGGHRDMKEGIAAQRSYEISFTAVVTDDLIYSEFFNEVETVSSSSSVELTFLKDSGERIYLKFDNYFLDTTNWTLPDDKGPIEVEGTIKPRTLTTSTVKTHWILQG
tara:strand:+ start:380 stop:1969 length:1590 start_codon:yes stop_codon:yes gene_type:complete